MQYLVIEIQTFDTGSVQTLTYSYETRLSAEAKYHAILSAAAVSKLPRHACVIMTSEGRQLMNQCYTHETQKQETEPASTE